MEDNIPTITIETDGRYRYPMNVQTLAEDEAWNLEFRRCRDAGLELPAPLPPTGLEIPKRKFYIVDRAKVAEAIHDQVKGTLSSETLTAEYGPDYDKEVERLRAEHALNNDRPSCGWIADENGEVVPDGWGLKKDNP